MYAIVETGGKQYQVEEGRYVDVELLGEEKDAKVVFDKVVMIVNGKKSKVGQPYSIWFSQTCNIDFIPY